VASAKEEDEMRHLKMIGLAVVVTSALLALISTAGAAAANTVLCQENVETCPAGKTYASGTLLHFETKSGGVTWSNVTEAAQWVTNLGTIKCDSTIAGQTTAMSGAPLPAKVTSWTFSTCGITLEGVEQECLIGGGTGNANNLPYTANFVATSGGNGTLNITAGTGGNPGVTVVCGAIINCTFSRVPIAFSFTGGAPMVANLEANAIAFATAGVKCPSTVKFTAKYFMTLPNANVTLTH
jgi:hypothetical protein